MANINVTYDEMDQQATRLEQARDSITQQLQQSQTQVQSLVSSGFVTDSASGAFEGSVTDFVSSANRTIETLGTLAGNLRNMANAYRETDQQIAGQMG